MCNWFSSSLEFIHFFFCECVQKSGLCVAVFLVVTKNDVCQHECKKLKRRESVWEWERKTEEKKPFKIICVVHINRICYRNIKKGVSIQRCSCWIELLYKLFTVRCYKKPLEMVVFRRMAYFDSCVSTSNISIRTRMHVSFVNIRSFNIMLCTVKKENIWEPFLKCEPGWFPFYYTWGPTS